MTPEEKKEYMRQYREKNKERIAAKVKEYQQKNSHAIKQYRKEYEQTEAYKKSKKDACKRYYVKNREKILENCKAKYLSDPAIVKDRVKKWQAGNKDKVLQYKKNYTYNNPAKRKEANSRWSKNNPDKRKANFHNRRESKKTGTISKIRIKRLLSLQRRKCYYCGTPFINSDFHVDHIIPLAKGGTNTDDNIQLLCPRCNLSKGAKDPIEFRQQQGFLL